MPSASSAGRLKRSQSANTSSDQLSYHFTVGAPERTLSGSQDYRMKVRDMSRNLKLTFIWRFNGFKPQAPDIDTSRFGTGK